MVPSFVAGYPGPETSFDLIVHAGACGADMVMIQAPSVDSPEECPETAFASRLVVNRGMDTETTLRLAAQARSRVNCPLVLSVSVDQFNRIGAASLIDRIAEAGVDGLYLPAVEDRSRQSLEGLTAQVEVRGLSLLLPVSPAQPDEAIQTAGTAASDLVVAQGDETLVADGLRRSRSTRSFVKRVRRKLGKPILVGGGINSADDARSAAKIADGAIIAASLISAYRTAPSREDGVTRVAKLLAEYRRTLV